VNEYPNTASGDIQAWGLTWHQALRYQMRLADYYARRARHFSDLSTMYAVRSAREAKVAVVLATIAAVLAVTVLVWRGGA
jgi:hypothetical protein